jgi:hypothetical protein
MGSSPFLPKVDKTSVGLLSTSVNDLILGSVYNFHVRNYLH